MKKWLKNNWNNLLAVLGVFLLTYNVFDFSYGGGNYGAGGLAGPGEHYYYDDAVLIGIALGTTLIAIGFLFSSKNKE